MDDLVKILAELKDIAEAPTPNDYLKSWKEKGGKAIGWFCTYVPEEIIYACGMLPYRVTGEAINLELADSYLYPNACSFARNCLEMGLKGHYDLLDGLVGCNTCDHIRRMLDNWEIYLKTPFLHIFGLPHKVTEDTVSFFEDQLSVLKEKLEELAGCKLSEDAIYQGIKVYNRTRELLQYIYDSRKAELPPISGTETLAIIKAATRMPRDEYNRCLEKLVAELNSTENPKTSGEGPRILICGSLLDKADLHRTVEEMGGLVVADELCTGSRYFHGRVDESLEPIRALAGYYLSKPPCARMRPFKRRFDYVLDLVKQFKVDGVIYEVIKFCDTYGYDRPSLKKELEKNGIPVLELDIEYLPGSIGQVKTRIQAFIEMLNDRIRCAQS